MEVLNRLVVAHLVLLLCLLANLKAQNPLDCSAVLSQSNQTLGWGGLLRKCFASYPYDTTQLPLPVSSSGPLVVNYSYSLIYLLNFEHNQLSIVGQLQTRWVDPFRMWNTSQIPLEYAVLPLTDVWYPPILCFNSYERHSVMIIDPTKNTAVIFWNGQIYSMVQHVLHAACNPDYFYFPYDTQNCSIEFQLKRPFPNAPKGLDVVIRRASAQFLYRQFENEEWNVVDVWHKAINITLNISEIFENGSVSDTPTTMIEDSETGFQVNILLQRYSTYYMINLLIPVHILTALNLVAMVIPEKEGEKVMFPITILLGFLFIQVSK